MAFGKRGNAVSIAFEGEDNVSPVVRNIKNSMAGFKQDAKQGFGLAAGFNIASTAMNLGAQAFGAVVSAAGDAQRAYSGFNEAQTKTNEVFKLGGPLVEEWAKTAAESFGLSERAALQASSTIGNFLQSLGTSEPDARAMSMSITGLAGDLASFNDVAGGAEEVLVSLRSGLAGEAEPMRRLGVDISAAAVEADLLANGIQKVNGKFQESDKIAARYRIIMKQTATAQGDFMRTADGSANQARELDARVENLNKTLGSTVDDVVKLGQELLITAVEGIGGFIAFVDNLDGSLDRTDFKTRALVAGIEYLDKAVKDGTITFEEATQGADELDQQLADLQALEGLQGTFDFAESVGFDERALDDTIASVEYFAEKYGLTVEEVVKMLQDNQVALTDAAFGLAAGIDPNDREGSSLALLDQWLADTFRGVGESAETQKAIDDAAGEVGEGVAEDIVEGIVGDRGSIPEELRAWKDVVTVGLGHGMSALIVDASKGIDANTIGPEAGAALQGALGEVFTSAMDGMDTIFGGFGSGRISGKNPKTKRGKGSLYAFIKSRLRLEKNNVRDLKRDPKLLADIQTMYDEHTNWMNEQMSKLGAKGNALGLMYTGPLATSAQGAADNIKAIGTTAAIAFAKEWGPAWDESVDPMINDLFRGNLNLNPGATVHVDYTNEGLLERMLNDDELRVTVTGVVTGKRAMGGDVAPHRSYLVGESGPEVVTLGGRGGSVTPNHALGGGGGGNVYLDGRLVGRLIDERLGQSGAVRGTGTYYRS